MWIPISLTELHFEIQKHETELNGELLNFWQLIKIEPEKWQEVEYGNEGGGFWVVAICGRNIIWYNDIENGFNISTYSNYGKIDEYICNKDQINWTIMELFSKIKFMKYL